VFKFYNRGNYRLGCHNSTLFSLKITDTQLPAKSLLFLSFYFTLPAYEAKWLWMSVVIEMFYCINLPKKNLPNNLLLFAIWFLFNASDVSRCTNGIVFGYANFSHANMHSSLPTTGNVCPCCMFRVQ